jgi:hypothetical protein
MSSDNVPVQGSLFVKRLEWLVQEGNQGTILCPRKSCQVKIGSYGFSARKEGGRQVGFQLFETRLDKASKFAN